MRIVLSQEGQAVKLPVSHTDKQEDPVHLLSLSPKPGLEQGIKWIVSIYKTPRAA